MLRKIITSLALCCAATHGASAQSPASIQLQNQIVTFHNISSTGIETTLLNGRKIDYPRHQVAATLDAVRPQTVPAGYSCKTVDFGSGCTPARKAFIFFLEQDFQDPVTSRAFFLCRRAMESTSGNALIQIIGNIEVWKEPGYVFVHSINSCFVTPDTSKQ